MLTLINTNRMQPPVAPIGLEYCALAAQAAGIEVTILDLGLTDDPKTAFNNFFSHHRPALIGLSLRNVDDCFWPSCQWFLPQLKELIQILRTLTDSPICLGGIGFSIFPRQIMDFTQADFGVRGDGETALPQLCRALTDSHPLAHVPGLIHRNNGAWHANPPAHPDPLVVPTQRTLLDNVTYFRRGGQMGFETKRGCNRPCLYCADPIAKGHTVRLRAPQEVADEIECLLAQGIDCFHTCDAEFNIPADHALAICQEFTRRSLGNRMRWYAYLSVIPFTPELAATMRKAGCVGIDFTTDAANPTMLSAYNQPYTKEDIRTAVQLCRSNGISVMTDLLLGGPGETTDTLAESIEFLKQINPDAVGTGLGLRIYPDTPMIPLLHAQGPLESNPNLKRKYPGPIDLLKPTFYIEHTLGPNPARLITDLINQDQRFFEPIEDLPKEQSDAGDHNYNANTELMDAIKDGARGAYWDILRSLK